MRGQMAGQCFSLNGDQENPPTSRMRDVLLCTLHICSMGPGTTQSAIKKNTTSARPQRVQLDWFSSLPFRSTMSKYHTKDIHCKTYSLVVGTSQRNHLRHPPPVMESVCHSGPPMAATVTLSTTVHWDTLGQTPVTTAR